MKMPRLSALMTIVAANVGSEQAKRLRKRRRRSKRPFFKEGHIQYPRKGDAEFKLRRGERVVFNPRLFTWFIVKKRRKTNKKR